MADFFDAPGYIYRLDDDWGFGGGDDNDDSDFGDEDDQQPDEDLQDDELSAEDEDVTDEDTGDLAADGGEQEIDYLNSDADELYASAEDLPELDPDSVLTADDFPNTDESDFEDDQGDWSANDYAESAQNIFGQHEFFGDSLIQQRADEGFQPFSEPGFARAFDQIQPGLSDSVHLFERDGQLFGFGLVSQAVLGMLLARYTGINLSGLEVAVPGMEPRAEPKPLPPGFAEIQEKEGVDLRQYATPVGDQRQTSRCSAFAWTHGVELSRGISGQPATRLSPNYTMWQFQKMQGDARDYSYAQSGGEGTVGGTEPGEVLVQNGTCGHQLWPDDEETPLARDSKLEADAAQYKLPGMPWPISIDDVKRVLSAGCPVHLAINTGENFSNVGRDGQFNAAEPPTGRHGRHAMLIMGYVGNFYIVKNSWGTDWGDNGYCYIPKNVLAQSNPEFIGMLLRKQ